MQWLRSPYIEQLRHPGCSIEPRIDRFKDVQFASNATKRSPLPFRNQTAFFAHQEESKLHAVDCANIQLMAQGQGA